MDSTKFDRLARALAASPSRRSVVRGLTAAALGVGIVGRADAADGNLGRCPNGNNRQCGDNEVCRNEECVCRQGFKVCKVDGRNRCVDQGNDNDNCGACGRRCDNQKRCVRGECRRFEEPEDGRCTFFGDCNETPCCAGFSCRAGNDAFRSCVFTG